MPRVSNYFRRVVLSVHYSTLNIARTHVLFKEESLLVYRSRMYLHVKLMLYTDMSDINHM